MQIELTGGRKRFGRVQALSGVDLRVEDGEFVTLLGPSGCGKTTLLRIVAGFESLDFGDLRFDGKPVKDVAPERRGVGLLFQNYALFPHMDVAANVGYGLRFHRNLSKGDRRARVASLLELVGLEALGARMPGQLSAGQQQRVAIARALATDPRALLLDEPLSALDAALRERLRLEIRRLQQRLGVTVIYVTHDQAEALSASDRIAVMQDGRIEQIGTPLQVYDQPATRFVARFVGGGNLLGPSERLGEGVPRGRGGWAVIRPERLWIDGVQGGDTGDPGDGGAAGVDARASLGPRLQAVVEQVEFLGGAVAVHLKTRQGSPLQSITYDPGRRAAALRLKPNQVVTVGCRADAVHWIPGPR